MPHGSGRSGQDELDGVHGAGGAVGLHRGDDLRVVAGRVDAHAPGAGRHPALAAGLAPVQALKC